MSIFDNTDPADPFIPPLTKEEVAHFRKTAAEIVDVFNAMTAADAMAILDLVVADQITRPGTLGRPLDLPHRLNMHLNSVYTMAAYVAFLRRSGTYNGPNDIKE